MEYEKPPIATAFSRKMRNRSHSLSISGNVAYDGVFASSANKKSLPPVDYGEVFRRSGPSSSSIPFLDVPELNEEKVKVDVRSSKLDYASVFGGFEGCDFSVSPEELIVKSKKESAGEEEEGKIKKAGKHYVPHSSKAKDQISSPEAVSMKQFNMSYHQTNPGNENGMNGITQIAKDHSVSGYTKMVDNTCPSQKMVRRTPVSSVKVEPCNGGPMEGTDCNEVKVDIPCSNASSKRSSKTEGEFQSIFCINGCNVGDDLADNACEIDSNAKHPDVMPPSGLQHSSNPLKDASDRSMGSQSGVFESPQSEDADAPCSPPYFDEETDANSAAVVSAAAVKKAIEEAQLRIKIAKQMMERNKEGFHGRVKPRSYDGLKVEDKGYGKDETETEQHGDNETQDFGEVVNSSRPLLPKGDHHVKRARKLWEVPGELLKSTLGHKQEEAEKHEAVKQGEEHARRARKHWEIPGGISKSVANGKQDDTENLAAAQLETHTNKEMELVAENSFYSLGQLGNKIKSVVGAFTGSKVEQKNDSEGKECGVKDSRDDFKPTHEVLVQEGEKKPTAVEPHETFIGPSDMETYEREVEEVPIPTESKSKTQIDENAELTMCILTKECSQKEEKETGRCEQAENACQLENAPKGKEIENKTPRRRRFWKTSEDVYEMIRFPKAYSMTCWLEHDKEEMVKRCLGEDSARVYSTSNSEETAKTSELPSDSGLQENWNVLKQMFRQMFQTEDTKREDETCCLVESQQMQTEIDQRAEVEDRRGTAETLICQPTDTDKHDDAYNQDEVETVSMEFQAHLHTRESEDSKLTLEAYDQKEHGTIIEHTKASLVYDLKRKELEAIEVARNEEGEVVLEASESDGSAQCAFELDEINKQIDNLAEVLQHDQSETNSSNSDEKFEQKPSEELAEETRTDSSIENDEGEPSIELRPGYSDIEGVDLEEKLSDQCPEKTSTASSMGEHVEEIDSESNKSGWVIEEMELVNKQEADEDTFKSYLEENPAGYVEDAEASQPTCKPEEGGESKEDMKTSQGSESDEGEPKQEYNFECLPEEEFHRRKGAEAAESPSRMSEGDEEMDAAAGKGVKQNDGEDLCRSLTEEKREVTPDASQKEAEPVEEHTKKADEAKEREREREKERIMVERAIREARERAFAEARERAERAAMEKASAGAHRKATTGIRGRSENASTDVSNKSSSADKDSVQAKLRAERAAVERALAEARERALEKALSGKAASQARKGSKSSDSSGDRHGFSSSGTQNKSSAPSKSLAEANSSNQRATGEPAQRCRARSERHQRTAERAAKALAEKKLRDLIAQKEQAERNRFAETLDAEVKRWSSGKEGNLRALLSTLQYILGPESGWKPIPLTDIVSSAAVRKAYRKATLYVHPDKLQQRGAGTHQKYTCEKVFDLLKEAWNKFSREER